MPTAAKDEVSIIELKTEGYNILQQDQDCGHCGAHRSHERSQCGSAGYQGEGPISLVRSHVRELVEGDIRPGGSGEREEEEGIEAVRENLDKVKND